MDAHLIYREKVSSKGTEFLFIVLTLCFSLVFIWRVMINGLDFLAGVFLFFVIVFLFYSINYRTLLIRLTQETLILSFGMFNWTIPLNNIVEIQIDDDLPPLMKYGGAGIHFMFVHKRYRASFNFLEHPRVVVSLKRKTGWVRDVSFSTCQPDVILRLVRGEIAGGEASG